ncbi:helix-turn-helix domain-containing protein [Streptomyces sp. NPDC087864]
MRAQVVLHAARRRSNARIARETGLHLDTVRTWRNRFAALGLTGLADRKRSGRPPRFTALQAAQVKALARRLPLRRRRATVALVVPGAGPRGHGARDRHVRAGLHRASPARPGHPQALAAPILDLHHRPGLPPQGQACAGPLRPHLQRQAARCGRVRHKRG